MHNSVEGQFHAVSLPVSSLLPNTDKAGFVYMGEAGLQVAFSHWPSSCLVYSPTSTLLHPNINKHNKNSENMVRI